MIAALALFDSGAQFVYASVGTLFWLGFSFHFCRPPPPSTFSLLRSLLGADWSSSPVSLPLFVCFGPRFWASHDVVRRLPRSRALLLAISPAPPPFSFHRPPPLILSSPALARPPPLSSHPRAIGAASCKLVSYKLVYGLITGEIEAP